jgi:hypothetical protein
LSTECGDHFGGDPVHADRSGLRGGVRGFAHRVVRPQQPAHPARFAEDLFAADPAGYSDVVRGSDNGGEHHYRAELLLDVVIELATQPFQCVCFSGTV